MKKQSFTIAIILVMSMMLAVCHAFAPGTTSRSAWAVVADVITPTITVLEPSSVFNDLDTAIVITGTGFTAELSGTQILSSTVAFLGNTALMNVTWVNSATLTATVPWGMDPGAYPLTVTNPDGGTGHLSDAFTVKQGIGQWNNGDLYGGAGNQVLLKPGDPTTLYVLAYYGGGLFRSRDAGEHWSYIYGDVGGNTTFVIDPLHPSWLYSNDANTTYHPFYRSQDEGDTWMKWIDHWPDGRSFDRGRVYPSRHDPQVIFLSSSARSGYPAIGALGLCKSTDGGASWHTVADMEGVPVTDVAFHPTEPLQMMLGTQAGKVFHSSDGGETWSEVTKPPLATDIGTITYNPYRPSEVWVSNGGMYGGEVAGLYKSTAPVFTTWQDVTATVFGNTTMWCIKFTSADSVYTIKQYSTDGGVTWNGFGPLNAFGEISFEPDDFQVGYIGDGTYGVQKTLDGGQTWQVKNQGFTGMIAHQIGASRFDPKRVFATFEWPGFYRSNDGANTWRYFPIENSFNVRWVREDPLDPQRLYVAADSGFYVSTNNGENWEARGWNVPPASKTGSVNAFVLDPYQTGHMLVGFQVGSDPYNTKFYGRLYSSNNYGETWEPISFMPGEEQTMMDIQFHSVIPGLVYLSTAGSGLYRSTDSGSTWERIDDSNLYWMQWLNNITIATHPQPILLVGAGSDPYRSWDGGATWLDGQAPYANGYSTYIFLNGDSTRLYAGNRIGLFLSSNAGTSWTHAAGTLGRLQITALGYGVGDNYTILYAATAGGDPGATSNLVAGPSQGTYALENHLVEAGIYRYVQHIRQAFLPLIMKP